MQGGQGPIPVSTSLLPEFNVWTAPDSGKRGSRVRTTVRSLLKKRLRRGCARYGTRLAGLCFALLLLVYLLLARTAHFSLTGSERPPLRLRLRQPPPVLEEARSSDERPPAARNPPPPPPPRSFRGFELDA